MQSIIGRARALCYAQRSCSPLIRTVSRLPQIKFNFKRSLTNTTKPEHITSLLSARRAPQKPGGWAPTLVHSSGEVKWTVIRLQPGGGQVPAHYHHAVWDYFIPLQGDALIEVKTEDGSRTEYDMAPGSFLAVGPPDTHLVRNKSDTDEFVFLIAQAPRNKYDYVPTGEIDYVFKE